MNEGPWSRCHDGSRSGEGRQPSHEKSECVIGKLMKASRHGQRLPMVMITLW